MDFYKELNDHSNDEPSALFGEDKDFSDMLDELIEVTDECILERLDLQIPGPMQSRVFLDWLCEVRRRWHINKFSAK